MQHILVEAISEVLSTSGFKVIRKVTHAKGEFTTLQTKDLTLKCTDTALEVAYVHPILGVKTTKVRVPSAPGADLQKDLRLHYIFLQESYRALRTCVFTLEYMFYNGATVGLHIKDRIAKFEPLKIVKVWSKRRNV